MLNGTLCYLLRFRFFASCHFPQIKLALPSPSILSWSWVVFDTIGISSGLWVLRCGLWSWWLCAYLNPEAACSAQKYFPLPLMVIFIFCDVTNWLKIAERYFTRLRLQIFVLKQNLRNVHTGIKLLFMFCLSSIENCNGKKEVWRNMWYTDRLDVSFFSLSRVFLC